MSSESSDEENLDLLREAADSQFINDSMFNKTTGTDPIKESLTNRKKAPEIQTLPSLRRNTTDESKQFNLLGVTPEFRNYVAKHLSRILEERLQKQISVKRTTDIQNNKNGSGTNTQEIKVQKSKKKSGGVRLFKNSKKFLKVASDRNSTDIDINNKEFSFDSDNVNLKNRNRPSIFPNKKQKVDVTERDLKRISVTGEDILNKKEVKHWSDRSKAPVFYYKQLETGELVEIENKNKRVKN